MIKELIENAGGKVEEVVLLPDSGGFAIGSFPLPEDHWLTANPEDFNVPPMPFRMGRDHPERERFEQALLAAGRYAARCATFNGKEEDFDPDALIQNLIIGFLGYHTDTGLSSDVWANPSPTPTYNGYDLVTHLQRQLTFSLKTFGPGKRTKGVIDHIKAELIEIEEHPTDLEEWIDVMMLASDGAWRAGYTPEQIAAAFKAKLIKNESRTWPDWRTSDPDKAIEHIEE